MLRRGPSISVPFVGGLDTKTDLKMTPMGSFQILENGIFSDHGTIKKRWGYDKHAAIDEDGGPIAGPRALAKWSGSLLLAADNQLYAKSAVLDSWMGHGLFTACSVDTTVVPSVLGEQSAPDCISNGTITAYIWADSRGGVRATVTDAVSGFVYKHDYEMDANGSIPRCSISEGKILLIWVKTSTNEILCTPLDDGDVSGSIDDTPVQITNSLASPDTYDVLHVRTTDRTIVTYISSDVGSGLYVDEIDGAGGTARSTNEDIATDYTLTATDMVHLCVVESSTNLLVCGLEVDGVTGFVVILDGTSFALGLGYAYSPSTTGTTINNMSICVVDSDTYILCELDAAQAWDDRVIVDSASTSPGTLQYTVRHAGIASRSNRVTGKSIIVLNHTSPGLQHCNFLYDAENGEVLSRIAYGESAASYSNGQLPGLWSLDGKSFGFSNLLRRRISTIGQAFETDDSDASTFSNTQVGHTTFNLEDAAQVQALEVGDSTYLSTGMLMSFTGVNAEESAPLLFPEDVELSDIAGGSGNMVDGATYLYRVYYERDRPNGETTRSLALTFGHTMTAASRKGRVVVPSLSHTLYKTEGDWRIAIYRTEANKTDLFYLVTSPDITATSAPNNHLKNDPDANTIAFDDDMADATLIKNKLDPQAQGEIPVVQPAPATVMGEAGDRIFLAGGEYRKGVVAPSLLHFPGEPVLFSDTLQFSVEEEAGDITAFGAIDGVLMVFCERRVYAVSGQGPDNTGAGGSFAVQRVTTDVGCSDAGSVVETPKGLMFKSAKGLYIISRSFDTEYIGWPVEILNDQSIVSAEVIPDTNVVVFLTSSGDSIAYDYFYDKWSTFTGHAGLDAITVGADYHYLRSNGEVYTRSASAYLDAGSWYALRIRTAPIRLDSVQDYMRVRRVNLLGEYLSSHRLQMKVFNNRDIAPFETRIFEPDDVIDLTLWGDADTLLWGDADTEPWGGTPGDTDYQIQHKFKRQKVQYLRLEFKDLPTDGAPGQSYELAEMNFEIGLYDGNARIPARRKL